ncbi:hypothetical protein KR032_004334, partial [Drosophila birchii]
HLHGPLSLSEEFHWKRFGLQYDSPFNFLRSQWQSKPKSVVFLAYRCLLGAFFGTGIVDYTVKYFRRGHCFIYLTNWSFYMCAITSIYAAILQIKYHCKKDLWVPSKWVIQIYWVFFWITLCIEQLVALTYWTLLYPRDRARTNPLYISTFYNIWTHALSAIIFTVDHLVVAQPARLLHFVYPVGFCLVYVLFTMIFYWAGGVNLMGRPYIYPFLNYSKPKKSATLLTLLLLLLIFCSVFQYGVYRFRIYLARKVTEL